MLGHRRQQARGGQGGEARPSGWKRFDPGHFRRQPQDLTQVPADTDRQHEHDQRVQPRIVREDRARTGPSSTGHHPTATRNSSMRTDTAVGRVICCFPLPASACAVAVQVGRPCTVTPHGPVGRPVDGPARADKSAPRQYRLPSAPCAPPARARTVIAGAQWRGRPAAGRIGKHVHSCIWTVCGRVRESREGLSGRRRQRGLTLGKTHHRGLRSQPTHRRRPGRVLRRTPPVAGGPAAPAAPSATAPIATAGPAPRRRRPAAGARRRLRRDRSVGAGGVQPPLCLRPAVSAAAVRRERQPCVAGGRAAARVMGRPMGPSWPGSACNAGDQL